MGGFGVVPIKAITRMWRVCVWGGDVCLSRANGWTALIWAFAVQCPDPSRLPSARLMIRLLLDVPTATGTLPCPVPPPSQLVLAAKTLVQLRLVVERHLPDMGPGTAALALSRLAGLAAATQRLRRAQQEPQLPQTQSQQQPLPSGVVASAPVQEQQQADGVGPLADPSAAAGEAPSASMPGAAPSAPTASAAVQLPPGTLQVELPATASTSAATGAAIGTVDEDDDSDMDNVEGGAVGVKPGGRAAADGGARVPRSSLRLMRRMLYHIAASVAPDLYASPPQEAAAATASASIASTSTRDRTATSSTSTSTSSYHVGRGRFSPPEHRAKLAGSVLAAMARAGLRPDAEDSRALSALLEASRWGGRPAVSSQRPLLGRLIHSFD